MQAQFAILTDMNKEVKKILEDCILDLEIIVSLEGLTFAECSDAEYIIDKAKEILARLQSIQVASNVLE